MCCMSNPTPLLGTGKALKEHMEFTRLQGLRLPTAAHDRLIASCFCFLHARELTGTPWKPEVRLAVHLVLPTGRFGNPSSFTS